MVVAACSLPAPPPARAEVTLRQFEALVEENRQLRQSLERQQEEINELRDFLESAMGKTLPAPSTSPSAPAASARHESGEELTISTRAGDGERRVIVSGQAGLAFFEGGSETGFPNAEFRVDDTIINIEAALGKRAYFFSELYLTRRETNTETFGMGEVYVDFENVSSAWGADGLLSVRLGRIEIPFGEEYLRRDPISNPLVTHSLADIWGIDEGVEIYGSSGRMSYVLAVQSGSNKQLRDFNSDKAVTARVGFAPARGWHLSASAMRTGDLDAQRESLSEIWIGNGFFRPIGSAATTLYRAELAQADARYEWRDGHVAAALGIAEYSDNDPAADNTRTFHFWHFEAAQKLSRTFYGAMRFSRLRTDAGYPLAGLGIMGKYFFGNLRTKELWRLGISLGHWVTPDVLLKLEYTLEEGELTNGSPRRHTNLFSTEAALRF